MPIKDPHRADRRQTAAQLYRDGASIRTVAAQIGRSYAVTHKLLREARVPLRDRLGRIRPTT